MHGDEEDEELEILQPWWIQLLNETDADADAYMFPSVQLGLRYNWRIYQEKKRKEKAGMLCNSCICDAHQASGFEYLVY
jgi:hypothetical protein